MAIAPKLKTYLDQQSADYQVVSHPHTESSMVTAAAAHVSGDQLAKAVIVKDDEAFLMVVVPSDYHVHLGRLHKHLGREVGLATEEELVRLFPDCDEGAAPPLGAAYDLPTLIDTSLLEQQEVYFDSGDHESLVKVSGDQFRSLLGDAERVNVGQHV
jgi:Ala-tRNA(Pro) deacylase